MSSLASSTPVTDCSGSGLTQVKEIISSCRIFSKLFMTNKVKAVGLYLFSSLLLFFFYYYYCLGIKYGWFCSPVVDIRALFAHISKMVVKLLKGWSAQSCSVCLHTASGPAAFSVFVLLNRVMTCSWDITRSSKGGCDSPDLGTSSPQVRGLSNLEVDKSKASGKSAFPTSTRASVEHILCWCARFVLLEPLIIICLRWFQPTNSRLNVLSWERCAGS